jgi:hypothetical protein
MVIKKYKNLVLKLIKKLKKLKKLRIKTYF